MIALRTPEALLSELRRAANAKPSVEELQKQRISFIMGTLKDQSNITRAKIADVLKQQEGSKP